VAASSSSAGVCCFDLLLGMCESVRMRNTLHIVVARKSSICYDAVDRRQKMRNWKRENM